MWHRILNTSSTSTLVSSKHSESIDKSESSKPMLKKAISMDSLHKKPVYLKKRNGSLDTNGFGQSYWFTNEKKSPTSEHSTSSQDETYVVALIGKPSVGKSTIVRTGLNNLAPITNVGRETNILHAPTLITEIDVDDHAYPVEVLEVQESVFDMKAPPVRWPKDLPEIDGILVCYDVTSRASISNIEWLLNAFREFQIPTILVACKADCESSKRQVDTSFGPTLGDLFNVGFIELDTRSDAGIQKIHDVFSMLLRLSIRHREFFRQGHVKGADSSSDSLFLHSVSSDAESEKAALSHRRTSSDLSHESRGRRKFSNLSAVRFMGNRYGSRFGTAKVYSRKSRSPLNRLSSDDEGGSLSRSLPRSIPISEVSKHFSSIVITPPQTPPTHSILSQVSLPPAPASPIKPHHPERNSYRRSILPSSNLLQVMEVEEERDIVSVKSANSRISSASYDSTLSSISGRSDNSLNLEGFFINDILDKGPNKCTGNRTDGMTIDELIHRLTVGGQYGTTYDDPFTITFFVIYRTFMRPRDVLVKLIQRFYECEKDIRDNRNTTHEKICNLLFTWITQHPNDMIHPHTRKMLRQLFGKITTCSHLSYYAVILDPLVNGTVPEEDPDSIWGFSDVDDEELAREEEVKCNGDTNKPSSKKDSGIGSLFSDNPDDYQSELTASYLGHPCRPSLSKHRKASLIIVNNGSSGRPICQLPFEEFPEKTIANELTYQEFQLFKKITARDLLRHIWSPQGSPQRENGRVAQSIKHFNFISNWVSTMILSQEKLKYRASMLKKFMKVAVIVRESNNYNTLMAIIAAINSAPISRLRRTREIIKGKSTYKKFHNLEVLMSTDKSFGNYRMALKAPSRGNDELLGIPYLGIHLQDLLSIGEGNRNFQEDGRIHWNKFSLMGSVINMIRKFQKKSYDIKNNKFIEKFIADTLVMSDDDLYNRSLDLEPRIQRSSSTSRVRR
ncbi:12188_t:CDS:10 [Funneliformis caledonium]|uniref:12188_t:CDS:1 n=1 Tax=Funneliformis caledonium TaxID=1117310 RepID=A0A9N9B0K6_9GLOM|nr:12188_t:CDS:10 [Funneliformis caledonium]